MEYLSESARTALISTFKTLGFQLALDGGNDQPFSRVFYPLGVEVGLSECADGFVKFGPRKSRFRTEMSTCLTAFAESRLDQKETKSLSGAVRFLREGCFGRCGARALREFQEHGTQASGFIRPKLMES